MAYMREHYCPYTEAEEAAMLADYHALLGELGPAPTVGFVFRTDDRIADEDLGVIRRFAHQYIKRLHPQGWSIGVDIRESTTPVEGGRLTKIYAWHGRDPEPAEAAARQRALKVRNPIELPAGSRFGLFVTEQLLLGYFKPALDALPRRYDTSGNPSDDGEVALSNPEVYLTKSNELHLRLSLTREGLFQGFDIQAYKRDKLGTAGGLVVSEPLEDIVQTYTQWSGFETAVTVASYALDFMIPMLGTALASLYDLFEEQAQAALDESLETAETTKGLGGVIVSLLPLAIELHRSRQPAALFYEGLRFDNETREGPRSGEAIIVTPGALMLSGSLLCEPFVRIIQKGPAVVDHAVLQSIMHAETGGLVAPLTYRWESPDGGEFNHPDQATTAVRFRLDQETPQPGLGKRIEKRVAVRVRDANGKQLSARAVVGTYYTTKLRHPAGAMDRLLRRRRRVGRRTPP